MRRLAGLVCCILASVGGAWGARCPPLPPIPPDLPPSFCDPAGGWEALPSLPAGESVPGMLLEPAITEVVQQALANATGWAPRSLPQLAATVDGCRRTVCGWFFWLRLNITCPHSGGQSAAELMLALPGRSRRSSDMPVVTVLDLDIVEAGLTDAEVAETLQEAAAAQELAGPQPAPGALPNVASNSEASGPQAGQAGPGRPPPLPAQFCGDGWAPVPGFDGLPAHLVDPGVVEQLQRANPVPCPLQDRYFAAEGCADEAGANRYWLRLGVTCVWLPGQAAVTEVLLGAEAGPEAGDAAAATTAQLRLLTVLRTVAEEDFKRRRRRKLLGPRR